MKTRISWTVAAALTLALIGQVTTYAQRTPVTHHASWSFQPRSFSQAQQRAQSIVLAQVVKVETGDDLVVPVKGEPNDEDRIPTQRVTMKVLKGYKGDASAGQTFTLFQTGGSVLPAAPAEGEKPQIVETKQVILEGDPLYKRGEKYLLMLENGPNNMLRTISPEGRFRQGRDGKLTPMVTSPATEAVRGKPFETVEQAARGERNIDVPADANVPSVPALEAEPHQH